MASADNVIERAARAFAGVRGVESVVLGGSRAVGCAGAHSDIDIGIYYDARTFDAEELRRRAAELDDARRADAATEPGAWGPWINGGGWLTVDGFPVDILYRDIARAGAVIDDCLRGNITIDYQCGHPFGFVNSIYMGEAACCVELFSASSRLREEKTRLSPFPEVYRAAAIDKFLWECGFSLLCGKKALGRGDAVYAAGSLFRCAVSLFHVLYAANGMYMLNEKGALARLVKSGARMPEGFAEEVTAALSNCGGEHEAAAFGKIERQYENVCRMTGRDRPL